MFTFTAKAFALYALLCVAMYALGVLGGIIVRQYKVLRYGQEADDPAIKRQTRIIACALLFGLGTVIPVLLHHQKDDFLLFAVTDFFRFATLVWGFCSGNDGRLIVPTPPWRLFDRSYLLGER